MRYGLAFAALAALLMVPAASAVTITNLDQTSVHLFVCDDKCGPSFGDDWGSAREFQIAAGEATRFDCSGKCFVGLYSGDDPPTLGDMAFADDDELFQGDDSGYVRNGSVTHKAN